MNFDGLIGKAADRGQDLIRGFLPTQGLRTLVVSGDEVLNGMDECSDFWVVPAFDLPLGEQAEPALHLIEPRGVGWREVQMVTGMFEQPALHERPLVRGIVIEHQMDLLAGWDTFLNQLQERTELLTAMPGKAAPDDLARGDVSTEASWPSGACSNASRLAACSPESWSPLLRCGRLRSAAAHRRAAHRMMGSPERTEFQHMSERDFNLAFEAPCFDIFENHEGSCRVDRIGTAPPSNSDHSR